MSEPPCCGKMRTKVIPEAVKRMGGQVASPARTDRINALPGGEM
jgi:hypothetical protein